MLEIQKVTNPAKAVNNLHTRELLAKEGINLDFVELWHDYAPRSKGKEYSPYARFYRDLVTGKHIMEAGILPHIKVMGHPIECSWLYAKNKYYSRANLFSAIVDGTQVKVTALSDQPTGVRLNDSATWQPQLFLNGVEQNCGEAVLLETDPINPNYHQNVLEWDYGICKRRARIVEGRFRDRITFKSDPHQNVRVENNVTGNMRLRFGSRDGEGMSIGKVVGDVEIISKEELAKAIYPITIGASPETFYPDAHVETSSVDGRVYRWNAGATWATNRDHTDGTGASDIEPFESSIKLRTGATNWYGIIRSIYLFDTSGLPDGATITAAVLSIFGKAKVNTFSTATFAVNIYSSNPASNTAIGTADYDQLGTTAYSDSDITYDAWSIIAYNNFTFNATGRAAISKVGISKFGAREATHDAADNEDFEASKQAGVDCYFAEQGDTTNDPKLVVTYTTALLVTPSTLALVITTYAPSISISDNQLVTPTTLALTLTLYASVVSTPRLVTPPTLALVLTTYIPGITVGIRSTPSTLALVLTAYIPTITTSSHQLLTPTTLALILTKYAPTVSTPRLVTPATLSLIVNLYIPGILIIPCPIIPVLHVEVAFATAPFAATPVWTDIADDVLEIHTRRGRQHELDRIEAGIAVVVVKNTDNNYWPDNASSPYYPYLLPGRRLRIRAEWRGVFYPVYTGFVENWAPSWRAPAAKVPIINLNCSDLIKNLSRFELNIAGYAQEKSDVRVGNVLDEVGWPAADRDLDTGQSNMIATGAVADIKAQAHLLKVQESELGIMFPAPDGDVQFQDRHARLKAPYITSQAIFGDDSGEKKYSGLEPRQDDQFIFNDIRLTRVGGTQQSAEDATSKIAYGHRTLSRTGLLVTVDTETLAQAQYLRSKHKDAVLRSRVIQIKPEADRSDLFPKVLTYDISTRITLRLNQASIDKDYHIENVRHDYIRGSSWITRWQLSDATSVKYWAIGVTGFSEIGETTKVAY